ncbi:cyclin-like protein [Saitoella complicata NRRL Y-17804]|uniref:cyclin-like protein n=1 Tax=Saitoella complicata (strain BCRC 22490 / CBS 7301 / JCM 7358 / NBRC 10748 / NRRL Y-17804) TaxID=698492 RepID=UPI000866AC1A|nr:cyclin-like protein [Saitoella complicata NRRL Y-17804]ODQ51590.1 cyclin-like protein [Saitoella complicata NRRL Y-17804]
MVTKACKCGSTDFEDDQQQGTSYCNKCGTVISENAIVAEVMFGESSSGAAMVQGSFLGANDTHFRGSGRFRNNNKEQNLAALFDRVHHRMSAVASAMGIREGVVIEAMRIYKVAHAQQFTKGRRSQLVVSACLYLACRMVNSDKMLIDFSDLLRLNVFVLGSVFLKLLKTLHWDKNQVDAANPNGKQSNFSLNVIDPSIYIHRFVSQLEFGTDTTKVATDATRLVKRMGRDWIHQGRRPAGICGACIFMAAKMNNYRRSIREIVHIVKVADVTIEQRLREFKETASANLTVEEFRNVDIESQHDPPSFLKDKKKKRKRSQKMGDEEGLRERGSEERSISPETERERGVSETPVPVAKKVRRGRGESSENATGEENENALTKELVGLLGGKDMEDAIRGLNAEEAPAQDENLSDLEGLDDDDEIAGNVLDENNPAHKQLIDYKTQVWTANNLDWLKAQKEKQLRREADEKAGVKKAKRKPRKKEPPRDSSNAMGASPAESIIEMAKQKPAMSKNINYNALQSLFSVGEDDDYGM